MSLPATHPWGRLRQNIATLGALGTAQLVIDRVLSQVSGGRARLITYALMAQPIGAGALAGVRGDAHTVVQDVHPGDALAAALPRPAAINLQRWAAGAQCMAATVKGAFAGMIWIARGHYDEDEVRCQYVLADAAHSVWDYDVYVEPRYRAGRLLARLWQAADTRLAAEGVRWTFSRIALLNRSSMAAHQRLGAQRVGTAAFLVLGPLQLSLFSIAPFVHIGLHALSRPALQLRAPLAR